MRLCPEVVNLLRLNVIDEIGDLFKIGQVAVVEVEASIRIMGIRIHMVDTRGIEGARLPYQSMHLIPLVEE